jgi:hypothetical protein
VIAGTGVGVIVLAVDVGSTIVSTVDVSVAVNAAVIKSLTVMTAGIIGAVI